MRLRRFALACLAASALCARGTQALAQDNSAALEALFAEGKKLVKEGKYAEACPKFLASYNLENRSGTLLNLADCYEHAGLLASAWARWVEAKAVAGRANQADRVQLATQRAAALEPKLSKLTIKVANPVPGLAVLRDGVAVAAAVYGEALPVDGGKHTIKATAPDHKEWISEVTIADGADLKVVEIPALAEQAVAPPPLPTPEPPPAEGHRVGTRTIVGLATAGVGVVALGVGSYFGFAAIGLKNKSNDGLCSAATNDCNEPQGVTDRTDALHDATASTALLVAGGVAVAGGVVLWLTDSSGKSQASVGFDGRVLRFAGSF
jgi:hypothetical protein